MAPPRCWRTAALLVLTLVALPSILAAQTVADPGVVEFTPSVDHDRVVDGMPLVDRYVLEFYAIGANVLLQSINLGKPSPDPDGSIRFVFGNALGTWRAPGVAYEARVTAMGPGGSTTSANSNPFSFPTATPPVPPPAGSACTYTLTPTSQGFNPDGGTATVTVTAPSGCAWTSSRVGSWITILSGVSSTGNGTVRYRVSANGGSARRTGTLTIAGQPVAIVQSAATAPNAPAGLRVVIVR